MSANSNQVYISPLYKQVVYMLKFPNGKSWWYCCTISTVPISFVITRDVKCPKKSPCIYIASTKRLLFLYLQESRIMAIIMYKWGFSLSRLEGIMPNSFLFHGVKYIKIRTQYQAISTESTALNRDRKCIWTFPYYFHNFLYKRKAFLSLNLSRHPIQSYNKLQKCNATPS